MRPTRLALAGAAAAVTAALTATTALAGGVLFQSPGQYRFSASGAGVSFNSGSPYDPSFTDVSVEQGTFIAHYTGAGGGSPSLIHATIVSLTMFQPSTGTFGSACFAVDDVAYSQSADLSTASLRTTLTRDEETTDLLPLVGGIGFTGKGGGGSSCFTFGTLPLPVTVDLTWTLNGPLGRVAKHGSYSCAGFQDTFKSSVEEASGTVTGTVSTLDGVQTSSFGSLDQETVDQVVQGSGTIQPRCLVTSIL